MQFSIQRVINRTLSPLGSNPLVFFGISFLFAGVGGAIAIVLQSLLVTGSPSVGVVLGVVMGFVIPVIASALNQGALIFAAVKSYRNEKASLGESISKALPHLVPLIAISLLMTLGLGLGFLLLVIPGVILLVFWSVTVPSRVVEKTGIIRSFGRSRDLARGHFWPILGLMVIVFIASMIIGAVFSLFTGMSVGLDGTPETIGVAAIIFTLLSNTITGALYASGAASLYYELRTVKEGAMVDEIADVFA